MILHTFFFSTVAWRWYFAVDASGKTPSVSEQRDLGWLIEYWLNCFELWPSSLYNRKVLRFVKWKLLPLIVLGLFYGRTSASHVPLRRLTGRGPGPSCFICAVSTWHLILTLLSLLIYRSNLSISRRWSSPGTLHFLLTQVPILTSPMSLLDQPH